VPRINILSHLNVSPFMDPFSSRWNLKASIHAGFKGLFHSTYPTKN
jgi:hypothetical protein